MNSQVHAERPMLSRVVAPVLLALAITAGACSSDNNPSPDDVAPTEKTTDDTTGIDSATAEPDAGGTTTVTEAPEAQLVGGNILGYDWTSNGQSSTSPEDILADLDRMGMNHGVWNPAFFHDTSTGTIQRAHQKMPTAETTADVAGALTADGKRISLKPIIDDSSFGGGWRGTFEPADPDAWFASYFSAVRDHYAATYEHGGRDLVIGTELSRLESPQYAGYWVNAIDEIRSDFPGTTISYSQNYDQTGSDPAFVDSLDTLGTSAYFTSLNGSTDFVAEWRRIVGRMQELEASTGVPRYFSELGMPLTGTRDDLFTEDKEGANGRTPDPNLVAEFIGAACVVSEETNTPAILWAASYGTSWIQGGVDLDATNGFYLGAPQNAGLARQIDEACN